MKINTIKIIRLVFIAAIFILLITPRSTYAQTSWVTLPDGKRIYVNKGEPVTISYKTENGELKSLQVDDPKEVIKIIVTLKDNPLAHYKGKSVQRKTSLTSVQSSLQAVHSTVKNKINIIAQQLSAGTNFQYQYKIRREYYTALNGMAMECNRGMMKHIRNLPEVKDVQLDGQVKADLTESVHQIRADIVQDSLSYNGDSVLVGEIDTGIDYNNPALGGGFGSGFRVIGGHDFANNDDDPMDDFGHGTHVAGIIGANGGDSLRGVAPRVKFLAVKVLSAEGMGTMSDVIAGIEYCMDPDGNPATDDAVDVINMSLGGQQTYNSPVDLAVDNATQAGILSVVAAGNNGLRPSLAGGSYETISSPGSAVTALTVGACDNVDKMADFSSSGPDPIHFAIKPEVVAPGVNILSTVLGNSTATISGTSMATPHVTGVAALLKQQHRDWSPEQLKAAIVNSAKSIGGSPYIQGNGRIDALNAATLGVMIQPGVLSFRLADLSLDVWKDTVEFKVKNFRSTSQNINLGFQGGLPAGVEVNLSQTSFTLASMQETGVTAIISVPKSVPILNIAPYAYVSTIICRSDSDRVQIPVGFVKTNILIIECDLQPYILSLYDKYGAWVDAFGNGAMNNKYTLTMGAGGRYDLVGVEYERDTTTDKYFCFVRSNINTTGLNYITLNHNEATFSAFDSLDQMRDMHDNPVSGLDSSSLYFRMIITYPQGTYTMLFNGATPQMAHWYLDTMGSSVNVGQQLFSLQGNQVLLLAKMSAGVKTQSDLALLSGSQNLGNLNMKFNYEDFSSPSAKTMPFIELDEHELGNSGEGGWTVDNGYNLPDLRDVHFMSNRNQIGFNPVRYIAMSGDIATFNNPSSAPSTKTATSDFIINENGDFVFFERKPFRPDLSEYVNLQTLPSGDTIDVQERWNTDVLFPKFQILYQYNNNSDLGISQFNINGYDDGGIICSNGMRCQTLDDQNYNVPRRFTAQLLTHNRSLQGQSFLIGNNSFYYDYTVNRNTDRYCLLANAQKYNLLGQYGQTTLDFEFTLPAFPFFPLRYCYIPSLDIFQILGNGKLTQRLHPDQDGTVRLVIFDPKNNVDSVGMYLLKNDGTEVSLTTTHPSAKEYFGTIPKTIPSGFLDVFAKVHNTDGNTFNLTVSPAFYYGESMDSVQYDARLLLSTYTLKNLNSVQFNPGDTLKYTLTYANYGNCTAENVSVHFPHTDYFVPVGDTTITIDSIRVSYARDSCRIPLTLVFLGKKQPNDIQSYYTPSITWNSGGKFFSRKHSMLIDFIGTLTNITELGNAVPYEYALSQNYPNPFNPSTTISFSLPEYSKVKIEIFNLLGQRVATLVDDAKPAGNYQSTWRAENLSSGVYFCKFKAEGKKTFEKTQKLVLMK